MDTAIQVVQFCLAILLVSPADSLDNFSIFTQYMPPITSLGQCFLMPLSHYVTRWIPDGKTPLLLEIAPKRRLK